MTDRETGIIIHRDGTTRVRAEKETTDKDEILAETGDNKATIGLETDKEDFQAEKDNSIGETRARVQVDTRTTDHITISRVEIAEETTTTSTGETTVGTGIGALVLTTSIKETEQIGDRIIIRTGVLAETEILAETGTSVETEHLIEVETRAETDSLVETETREAELTKDIQADFSHKVDQRVEAEIAAHPMHGSQKNATRE